MHTTPTAYLLLPAECEAYLYQGFVTVGTVTASHDNFMWYDHMVYGKVGQKWMMVYITADTAHGANYLARYQADRIMSGMHPCYVKEA